MGMVVYPALAAANASHLILVLVHVLLYLSAEKYGFDRTPAPGVECERPTVAPPKLRGVEGPHDTHRYSRKSIGECSGPLNNTCKFWSSGFRSFLVAR